MMSASVNHREAYGFIIPFNGCGSKHGLGGDTKQGGGRCQCSVLMASTLAFSAVRDLLQTPVAFCLRTWDILGLSTGQVGRPEVLKPLEQLSTNNKQEEADEWTASSIFPCDGLRGVSHHFSEVRCRTKAQTPQQELAPNAPSLVAFPSLPHFCTSLLGLREVTPNTALP